MGKELWKPGNMLYPLPAVMVSLADQEGHPNIITLAWVGTVCTNPPMVSISVRPERYSYPILKETGEFVINLTTRELVYATDYCGVRSGRDVDKFKGDEAYGSPCIRGESADDRRESREHRMQGTPDHAVGISRYVSGGCGSCSC